MWIECDLLHVEAFADIADIALREVIPTERECPGLAGRDGPEDRKAVRDVFLAMDALRPEHA